jgi:hypothetical protein
MILTTFTYIVYLAYFCGILYYKAKIVNNNFKLKEKYQLGFNEFQRFDITQFDDQERLLIWALNKVFLRFFLIGLLVVFLFTLIVNLAIVLMK